MFQDLRVYGFEGHVPPEALIRAPRDLGAVAIIVVRFTIEHDSLLKFDIRSVAQHMLHVEKRLNLVVVFALRVRR